jgi:hypothetical protein
MCTALKINKAYKYASRKKRFQTLQVDEEGNLASSPQCFDAKYIKSHFFI